MDDQPWHQKPVPWHTEAQALVPGLIVNNAEPEGDAEALERLALWALRLYAPIVAADPPDGLVIDTTGAAHLHGGEDAMLEAMIARFAASGFTARAAIADSWSAAYAFARYTARPILVVPPGESATAILDLPIAALRLPKDMVESLRVLGFERIGELVDKPRAPLTLRFGPELGRCLDQVMGRISEPIDPIRPPDLIEVRQIFGEPIAAAETIARYIGKRTNCANDWKTGRIKLICVKSSPNAARDRGLVTAPMPPNFFNDYASRVQQYLRIRKARQ